MTTQLAAPNDIEIERGIAKCKNAGELLAMASMMMQSGFVPSSFKTPQQVFMAIQYGAELKLTPMAALNSIAVINGKPSLYGAAVPGVAEASGQLEDWKEWIEGEGDNCRAFCRVKRKGIESPLTGEFSALDAKVAGLWGRAGPWKSYPKDMLRWKARARAFRPLFGDVLNGMQVYEDLIGHAEVRPLKPEVSIVDPLQITTEETRGDAGSIPATSRSQGGVVQTEKTPPFSQPEYAPPSPSAPDGLHEPGSDDSLESDLVMFASIAGSAAKGFTLKTAADKLFSTPSEDIIAYIKKHGKVPYNIKHFGGVIETIEVALDLYRVRRERRAHDALLPHQSKTPM